MNPKPNTTNTTPIETAFQYATPITYAKLAPKFGTICIYCGSKETIMLLQDGSFRQCHTCRKNFKPTIEHNKTM